MSDTATTDRPADAVVADPRTDRLQQFLDAPKRALWTMALPMMAGMTVQTTYIVADTAFIGSLGTDELAAATFVAPLFFLMIALTMGIGTAVTALVAQAVGRGDAKGADAAAGAAISSGLFLGFLLGAIGLAGGRWILAALGAEGRVVDLGWEYFQVLAAFLPLFFIAAVLRSILTGEGDAKTPMIVLAISTTVNIALDALFILVLGMGLRGAAIATTIAVGISVSVFSVLMLRRKSAFVRLRVSALVPSREILVQLYGLAIPIAASMVAMSAGTILFNLILADFGSVAVAAYGAASKVDMIVVLPIYGLSGAAVTVVGMFAGAGRTDLVRSTALYTYRWAISLAAVIGGVAYLSSGSILRVFTSDPTALSIGATYLGFMIFAYPMMAVGMTTGRLLQGLGHGFPALLITTIRVLLVGVPVAWLAVNVFDQSIRGVWIGILTGGVFATICSLWMVRQLMGRSDPSLKAVARA
ncbi:MAG TPA: MATE family efflux transporter [Gemmatimonadetes bacterium]|nr:MATE family efflux transporter [Gemmatimonadota bacterium]